MYFFKFRLFCGNTVSNLLYQWFSISEVPRRNYFYYLRGVLFSDKYKYRSIFTSICYYCQLLSRIKYKSRPAHIVPNLCRNSHLLLTRWMRYYVYRPRLTTIIINYSGSYEPHFTTPHRHPNKHWHPIKTHAHTEALNQFARPLRHANYSFRCVRTRFTITSKNTTGWAPQPFPLLSSLCAPPTNNSTFRFCGLKSAGFFATAVEPK